MDDKLILAIDFGTQSVRALVFDPRGEIIARGQRPVAAYTHPQPGWTEHDVNAFWVLVADACQDLWANSPITPQMIDAVVVTTQRATVINLDSAGQPLRPAIIWTDQRRALAQAKLPWYWRVLFKLLGIHGTVKNLEMEAEASWLAQNQPEILAKTAHYLLLSGYLNYRFTNNYVDSVGSQVGYIPFDFKRQDWCVDSDWKWACMPVKREMLPTLLPVGSLLGEVTEAAAEDTGLPVGVPVFAGAADKACEVLGSGAIKAGIASISCGTTATINTTQSRYIEVVPFMPAYPAAIPACYNTEIQVFRGFWLVTWFKEQFGHLEQLRAAKGGPSAEALLDDLLGGTNPGADGLLLQPFWNPVVGETGPEGRGSIIGFNESHTRAHVYRALIEGLAYALRSGKEKIERRTKRPIDAVRVAGGGAQSDAVMQVLADVLNLPAERLSHHEASGLGAAIIGATSLGCYESIEEAAAAMTHVADCFRPNEETTLLYERLYEEVYQKQYGRLKPLYLALTKFNFWQ